MIQFILELFTSTEKAETMLANSIIEFIFVALFTIFVATIFIHIVLYFKVGKVRNYLKDTGRMEIEPLNEIKDDFNKRQINESVKVDTFVQEKFSNWRLLNIPMISLIKLVQMTVSVFILLGVLGTFIGLTISLGSINGTGDQLVEHVSGVLSGIDIAFYTSIIGMSFSLVMTVLIKILNTEFILTDLMLKVESQLEGFEQQGMGRMIEVSEAIHGSLQTISESFIGFKDYTAGLEQSAKDLAVFNEGLSENLTHFQELFQQMKIVTDGFSEGTNELNKNFKSLFNYFKKSDRRNERLVETFENTITKMNEVTQAQIDNFKVYEESVDELKEFTSSVLVEQQGVNDSLTDIKNENKNLVDTMGEHNRTFKKVFGSDLETELSGIKSYLNELRKGFDTVGNSIGTLPDALDVINKTQAEYKTLLTDRFDDLKEFNRTFNNHLKSHSTYSDNLNSQMNKASTTFEQMASKNNKLLNNINETNLQVKKTFSERDRQIDTNVEMLKSTLANYVANLEGTLGQKLDAVIRNISESMDRASGTINRDFTDMRRQSEDIQENHARATQQLLQDLGREIVTLNRQLERLGQQTQSVQRIGMNRNEF